MPEPPPTDASKDFKRFRQGQHHAGMSRLIGQGFCDARDATARALLTVGVTPNGLTLAGFAMTCGLAICLLLGGGDSHAALREAGRPPYLIIAFVLLILASACDMLDGAVARIGNLKSPLGAVLDSCVDRMSDAVVYVALVGCFLLRGNLTYGVFAALAMTHAMLISYVKARSECEIPNCEVGYWMRGERSAALLISLGFGNISALLWQQALLPALTVLRRLVWVYQVLKARAHGRPDPSSAPAPGVRGLLRPWRYPRGSLPYDVVTGINILFLAIGPRIHPVFGPTADPLGDFVRHWVPA